MTKGRKTGGRDFEPGWKGGPGQPPIPPELKAARRLNKVEFELMANRYIFATEGQLLEAKMNAETPALEKVLVNVLLAAIENGDQTKGEWFLQRLLGKVKDEVEVSVVKPFIITRLNGDTIELGSKPDKKDKE